MGRADGVATAPNHLLINISKEQQPTPTPPAPSSPLPGDPHSRTVPAPQRQELAGFKTSVNLRDGQCINLILIPQV